MIIKQLQLKNFGKFHNTTLELKPGINVIYGENESGKSTLHSFIKAMFFGLRKQRGRAARTDEYARYTPWENPGWYEGSVRFACGGKEFRLERNFRKGEEEARLVCETDGELLSVQDGDLEVLLGGISETVFDNTVSVGQMKSRTGESLVQELQNYLSNYQGSGDGRLDVEKARTALKARKKEWEDRAGEREQIQEREEEKLRYESQYLREEINTLEEKIREETIQLESEKKEVRKKEQETDRKPMEYPKQQDRVVGEDRGGKDRRGKGRAVLLTGGVSALLMFAVLSVLWSVAGGVIAALLIMALSIILCFFLERCEEDIREDNTQPDNKIGYDREQDNENLQETQGIRQRLNQREGRIRLLKSQAAEKQIRLSNLSEELEELRREFVCDQSVQKELEAVSLARETLERLVHSMQDFAGETLKEEISRIFTGITGGRYQKVSVDENLQIELFTEDRHVPLFMVSSGTTEQVYLALRLAVGHILCHEEPMPVLLDETFSMYDDKRLEQTLRWLAEEKEQVLIFTCNQRERDMLNKCHVPHHLIRLVN